MPTITLNKYNSQTLLFVNNNENISQKLYECFVFGLINDKSIYEPKKENLYFNTNIIFDENNIIYKNTKIDQKNFFERNSENTKNDIYKFIDELTNNSDFNYKYIMIKKLSAQIRHYSSNVMLLESIDKTKKYDFFPMLSKLLNEILSIQNKHSMLKIDGIFKYLQNKMQILIKEIKNCKN